MINIINRMNGWKSIFNPPESSCSWLEILLKNNFSLDKTIALVEQARQEYGDFSKEEQEYLYNLPYYENVRWHLTHNPLYEIERYPVVHSTRGDTIRYKHYKQASILGEVPLRDCPLLITYPMNVPIIEAVIECQDDVPFDGEIYLWCQHHIIIRYPQK